MDSSEIQNEPLHRCLMCWEMKRPNDFAGDALYGKSYYCCACDTIQRAHAKAYLRALFDWTDQDPPYSSALDGIHVGARWREYIIEYLYGSLFAAMTQRVLFAPERYRGSLMPLLEDGVTPLVWRIRLFHSKHRGYAEGWWNPHSGQWDWSLRLIDPESSVAEWSEWRRAMRDASAGGRPPGKALAYLSTVSTFLAHCREVVSAQGWPEAARGMDAIKRKQLLRRVREGTVTQAQLGEILGCGHRTITLALARFKESDQLEWHDLQRLLAEWSREP